MKTSTARIRFMLSSMWVVVSISFIFTACLTPRYRYKYTVPIDSSDGWRTASLSEMGMDSDPIVRLMNSLHRHENHLIHSIVIVKDGSLVFEQYFDGGDVDLFREDLIVDDRLNLTEKQFNRYEPHYCASVSKSVTSQLIGIALEQGYITGTDAKMLSFFPDYAGLGSPEKDQITIHQMLAMTTGLPFDEQTYPIADSRNDAHQLFISADPVAFVFGKDVVHAPGTTYRYNSGTTVVLGEIIRRTTGRSVPSFAEEHLFKPLQISSYMWAPMPEAPEIAYAPGGLYLRPRDMAKIGQLMLQEGIWNGNRVLSSDWVHNSVTQAIPVSDQGHADGYGYQWKLGRFGGVDAYWADGWGGQYIVIFPDLSLVFVQTAGRYQRERIPFDSDEVIENYILPAIGEYQLQSQFVDLTGEWIGFVIMGDGTRSAIHMSLVKGEDGYTGAIRGLGSPIQLIELRNIVFEKNRLTCELDFTGERGIELITIDLSHWDGRLEGSYTDPTGHSDKVALQRER